MPKFSEFASKSSYDANYYVVGYDSADATDSSNLRVSLPNLAVMIGTAMQYGTPITVLTGTFGSAGDAIADVGGSFNQTTLNNNFRALEDKVNAIHAALLNAGLITTS